MNNEIDPVADQNYEIWNGTIFSQIFQRKISANRLALVGMAGWQRPQLGISFC